MNNATHFRCTELQLTLSLESCNMLRSRLPFRLAKSSPCILEKCRTCTRVVTTEELSTLDNLLLSETSHD